VPIPSRVTLFSCGPARRRAKEDDVNETYVTLTGTVATKPEAKMHDGIRLLSFRLVSTARKFDKVTGSFVDGDSTWVTVTCWRALAVNVEESVTWKDRVIVHGRLRTREWTTTEGVRRSSANVTADSVGPDLTFGTSVFSRRARLEAAPALQVVADALADQVEDESLASRTEVHEVPFAVRDAAPQEPEDEPEELDDLDDEGYAGDGVGVLVGTGAR
jgi:single-strand DNA-binding protein